MPDYDIWNFTETNENICEKLIDDIVLQRRYENGTFLLDLTKEKYSYLKNMYMIFQLFISKDYEKKIFI